MQAGYVGKDLNLQSTLFLEPTLKEKFMRQLKIDAWFLQVRRWLAGWLAGSFSSTGSKSGCDIHPCLRVGDTYARTSKANPGREWIKEF